MARLFIDGFESGSGDLWNLFTGAINNSYSGRVGTYCAYFSSSQVAQINLSTSKSSLYVAFKAAWSNWMSYNYGSVLQFRNGTTILGSLTFMASNQLKANRGFYDATLASFPSVELTDTWAIFEVYYLPHLSNGSFIVKKNGLTVVNVTGVQTAPSTTNIDNVVFGINNSGCCFPYMDDIILDDANWIGYSAIQKLSPTGAGATTAWDPSTGNNWDCVEEIPFSDNDYVSTNVSGEVDTYALANLSGTVNSVKSVQVQARCMREGSASQPNIKLVTRPASTDRVSDNKAVSIMTPKSVCNIWTLNPEDSAAWEASDVNSIEIGVRAES